MKHIYNYPCCFCSNWCSTSDTKIECSESHKYWFTEGVMGHILNNPETMLKDTLCFAPYCIQNFYEQKILDILKAYAECKKERRIE